MNLNNVKIKEQVYKTPDEGKINIDLDGVSKLVDNNSGCRFTPKGVLDFCKSFKVNKECETNKENKEKKSPLVYSSESERNLHEVFNSSVPDSYDYAVLAHILLAQGRIKSKIVSVPNPKNDAKHHHRAFVIFANNGTTYVLDAAVDDIVELEDGKPYGKKGVEYTVVDSNVRLVSVKDVPDYNPQK